MSRSGSVPKPGLLAADERTARRSTRVQDRHPGDRIAVDESLAESTGLHSGQVEPLRESEAGVEETSHRHLLRKKRFEEVFKKNWGILYRLQLSSLSESKQTFSQSVRLKNCPDYLVVVQKTSDGYRSRKLRVQPTLTVQGLLEQVVAVHSLPSFCLKDIQLANKKHDICLHAGEKETTIQAVFANIANFSRKKYAAIEVYLTRRRRQDSNGAEIVRSEMDGATNQGQSKGSFGGGHMITARDLAEALCIEGDVERLEDRLEPAVSVYCRAYSEDPNYAVGHLKTFARESLEATVAVLEELCFFASDAQAKRSKIGVELTCEHVCDFLLGVAPTNGPANSTKVELMFQEKKYSDIIDWCTGLLAQKPSKPTHVVLQRGLAYLLLGKREKHVISDYLKAFIGDRDETEAYIRQAQETHLPKILELFRTCANSEPPAEGGLKAREQWRNLVIDCYRFLLVFKPNDTKLLQALANNLKEHEKFEDAVDVLTKALQSLSMKFNPSTKLTKIELLVSRSECHVGVKDGELAVKDLNTAVNTDKTLAKSLIFRQTKKHTRKEIVETALQMAEKRLDLFKRETKNSALGGENQDRKVSLIKQALQYYKLILVLVQKHKQATFGCAECLCLTGDHNEAVQLYSSLLDTENIDCATICARGRCHLHRGEMARGYEDFVRALQRFPNSVQALCARGHANLTFQDSNGATKDYMKAISINVAESVEHATDLPVSQQQKLQQLIRREADKLLERALKRGPRTKHGGTKSKLQDETRKIIESVLDVAEFLKFLDLNDVNARLLKVDALRQLRRHEEAEQELAEFIDRHPDNEIAMVHLSTLRMRLGKSKQAVKDYIDVLRVRGSAGLAAAFAEIDLGDRVAVQEEAHRFAVQLLREEQRSGETLRDAIDCFTVAIAATGVKASKSLLARAECHAHIGNQLAAIADFSSVLKIEPDAAQALCGRASMRLTLNHRKESVADYLLALSTNFRETKNHVASLPEQPRLLAMYWLHMHAVSLLSQGTPRYAKLIGQLLVALDEGNSTWHSLCADALIVEGNFGAALTHLGKVIDLNPKDATAIARCALIHIKLGNMTFAVLHLGKLAEDDLQGLHFVLKVLDADLRDEVVKRSSDQAETLTRHNKHKEALNFYSLAVMASDGERTDLLRKRAKCLTRLEEYDRAESDLTEVLKLEKNSPLASDFCARGHVYLLHEKEHRACNDYIRALNTNSSVALSLITSKPGRANLARVFLGYARYTYDKKKLTEASMICEFGLKIDEKHSELKRLKARINKQLGSSCSVQ
ncbi:uncharacterized protein [Ptychodera flava]|uniref:uncharacterized protein n=1 Tax=Ptychodera flava TaxID=63121 RepID=UPI00396A008B